MSLCRVSCRIVGCRIVGLSDVGLSDCLGNGFPQRLLVLLRIIDPYASVLNVQDVRFALLHVRTGLLVEDLAMLAIDLGIVRGLLVL